MSTKGALAAEEQMTDWIEKLLVLINASGKTQETLAAELRIHRVTLNHYLNRKVEMPSDILMRILQILGASPAALSAEADALPLRFRCDEPNARDLPAVAQTLHRFAMYTWLEDELAGSSVSELSLPSQRIVERDQHRAEIANLARSVRVALGLPDDGPVPTFIACLQSAVKLLAFQHEGKPDGFSAVQEEWGNCLSLNTLARSPERVMFTAAHELGHLVCGHHSLNEEPAKQATEIEQVADYFAGCFLVPADTLNLYVKRLNPQGRPLSLPLLTGLKSIFGVSYHCLLTRLAMEKQLKWPVYNIWKERLYPGGSVAEPEPSIKAPEYEERLRLLAVTAYQQEIIGEQKFAEMLNMPATEAWEYLKGATCDD